MTGDRPIFRSFQKDKNEVRLADYLSIHVNRIITIYNNHSRHYFFFGFCRYIEDDEGIKRYFAAFHLLKPFPAAVVIDDFGDFFDER